VTKKIRVTTVLGTRPELIRLACIIEKLELVFEHRIVHTGQNFNPMLSTVFLDELRIPKIDNHLNIKSSSLGEFCAQLFVGLEQEFNNHRPDAVLILGDTNSALGGIIAKRLAIPVYHLEAGNRSFDNNVPEEINRKIVDHFADYNLAYTQHAKANLLHEGLNSQFMTVIGSPLREVLNKFRLEIDASSVLESLDLAPFEYFLVSAHRQENVDNEFRLRELVSALSQLSLRYAMPVVISTHPRTRERIEKLNLELNENLIFHEPFGFYDYNKLQLNARIVLSDSGSISEESAILGFPAVTIRDSMERPEALESGNIIMCGVSIDGILNAVEVLELMPKSQSIPDDYQISDTSTRVIKFIASTVQSHAFRSGLRSSDS
jgi:UDP-N-acetylglucosamine 2-epimerase (non-hydrolysing)